MKRYAVLTDTFITGWVNCWTDGDGYPLTFATLKEAEQALDEHFAGASKLELLSEDYKIEELTE